MLEPRKYKRRPPKGVTSRHADGLYATETTEGGVQVLVVGPMPCTPDEIAADFPGYRLESVERLPPADWCTEAKKQRILERPFTSVDLARLDA